MNTKITCPYVGECEVCSFKNLKECHLLTKKLISNNFCPERFHQGCSLKRCFCDLHPDIKKIFTDEPNYCYINGDCFRSLDENLGDIITRCYFGITESNANAIKKIIAKKIQVILQAA